MSTERQKSLVCLLHSEREKYFVYLVKEKIRTLCPLTVITEILFITWVAYDSLIFLMNLQLCIVSFNLKKKYLLLVSTYNSQLIYSFKIHDQFAAMHPLLKIIFNLAISLQNNIVLQLSQPTATSSLFGA